MTKELIYGLLGQQCTIFKQGPTSGNDGWYLRRVTLIRKLKGFV